MAGQVAPRTTDPTVPGDATAPTERPTPGDVLVSGGGAPVTVFAPGLGASTAETRPFGSGVAGTRVFLTFHSRTYADLADELRRAADAAGARRAVGVSLGAGAIMRLIATAPDRFERLVLVLPASLDSPRPDAVVRRIVAAADLIDSANAGELARALLDLQPPSVRHRPDARTWARTRATELAGTPAGDQLRAFAGQPPLSDRGVLAACSTPVLVLGQEGDDLHPASCARDVAAALPRSELEIFPPGGLLWAHRRAVRARISGFLAD